MSTMIAEHGTSVAADRKIPAMLVAMDMAVDMSIMPKNRWFHVSAISTGTVSIDISNIMPTSLMVSTIHTATSMVMV